MNIETVDLLKRFNFRFESIELLLILVWLNLLENLLELRHDSLVSLEVFILLSPKFFIDS